MAFASLGGAEVGCTRVSAGSAVLPLLSSLRSLPCVFPAGEASANWLPCVKPEYKYASLTSQGDINPCGLVDKAPDFYILNAIRRPSVRIRPGVHLFFSLSFFYVPFGKKKEDHTLLPSSDIRAPEKSFSEFHFIFIFKVLILFLFLLQLVLVILFFLFLSFCLGFVSCGPH